MYDSKQKREREKMMQSLFQDEIDYSEHVAARIELLQELLELYSDPRFEEDLNPIDITKATYHIPTIIDDWGTGCLKWKPGYTYLYKPNGQRYGPLSKEDVNITAARICSNADLDGLWLETCSMISPLPRIPSVKRVMSILKAKEAAAVDAVDAVDHDDDHHHHEVEHDSKDNNDYKGESTGSDNTAVEDITPPEPTSPENNPQSNNDTDENSAVKEVPKATSSFAKILMLPDQLFSYLWVQTKYGGGTTNALLPLNDLGNDAFNELNLCNEEIENHPERWKVIREIALHSIEHYVKEMLKDDLEKIEVITSWEGYQILVWCRQRPKQVFIPKYLHHPSIIFETVRPDSSTYMDRLKQYVGLEPEQRRPIDPVDDERQGNWLLVEQARNDNIEDSVVIDKEPGFEEPNGGENRILSWEYSEESWLGEYKRGIIKRPTVETVPKTVRNVKEYVTDSVNSLTDYIRHQIDDFKIP